MKEKIIELFKTEITGENKKLQITDEFTIYKVKQGDEIIYALEDETTDYNYVIIKSSINNIFDEEEFEDFKEFLLSTIDEAFEDRKREQIEQLNF